MGENSAIEWCDHTFNPWEGCQKVSPGCDHCYAEARDQRFTGGALWGPHAARRRTSPANWAKPQKWNRDAAAAGKRARVFCASLADVFDNHASITSGWHGDLWHLIAQTPNLDWLLLTKRPQNIARMLPETYGAPEWGSGWPNVWLGTTVENQTEADRRIPHLLNIPAAVRFLSVEPMLGPVKVEPWLPGSYECATDCGWRGRAQMLIPEQCCNGHQSDGTHEFCPECGIEMGTPICPHCDGRVVQYHPDTPNITWIICGGESGHGARPMHPDWPRSLRDQCAAAGVPFFFKQWGEWGLDEYRGGRDPVMDGTIACACLKPDGSWAHFQNAYAPPVTEGSGVGLHRFGKKAAGRLLDGREWSLMPRVA